MTTGTFGDVQLAIDNTENSGTVYLNNTYYTLDSTTPEPIIISKNIVVDGSSESSKGFSVIDGKNLIGLFIIKGGKTVSFINIEFRNGNAKYGGAIYNEPIRGEIIDFGGEVSVSNPEQISRSTLTVTNSRFINNTAITGGAINCYIVNAFDSVFINNTATSNGGCIFADNCTVRQSTFINNKAANYGGVLYGDHMQIDSSVGGAKLDDPCGFFRIGDGLDNYIYAYDSTFINNSAVDGSAIYAGYADIKNSNFYGNNATNDGAIFGFVKVDVVGSTFINNSANGLGAAICAHHLYSEYNLNVKDSKFIGNVAKQGAALWTCSNVIIQDTLFKNNSVSKEGGAIYTSGTSSIINSNFTDNKAEYGAAVYYKGCKNSPIINSIFENNMAQKEGGAIYYGYTNKFSSSSGVIQDGGISSEGSVIVSGDSNLNYCSNCIISQSKFIGNVANKGGAISGTYVNVKSSEFINNSADVGGAINGFGASSGWTQNNVYGTFFDDNNTITTENCKFENNSAKTKGGSIYASKINLQTTEFKNNGALEGGAIYSYYDANIINSIFNLNNATTGGAIYAHNNLMVSKSKFNSNNASSIGGAIYSNVGLTTIESTFIGNIANNGGAIYLSAVNKIYNSTFINNSASYGGAIDGVGGLYPTNVYLKNSNFINNSATISGGAISYYAISAQNSTFVGNKANDGGALIANHVFIRNSTFNSNIAENNGGAIQTYYGNIRPYCELSDSNFINNSVVKGKGSSIFIYGDLINTTNCYFADNGPASNVICRDGVDIDITYDNFTNNSIQNSTKNNLIINVNNVSMYYKDAAELVITALDNDFAVKNIDLNVTIGGVSKIMNTGADGVIVIPVNLTPGHYGVVVRYQGTLYKDAFASSIIDVELKKLHIDVNNVSVAYNEKGELIICAWDNDFAVKDIDLTVIIGTSGRVMNTGADGVIIIPLKLQVGHYDVSVRYDGSDYVNTTVYSTIDIGLPKLRIDVNNVSVAYNEKGELIICAWDNDFAVKDIDLTVIIGTSGRVMNTGADGVIILPVELAPGHYDVSVRYNGDLYQKTSVNATIDVGLPKLFINAENVDMYFKDGTRFIVSALANDVLVKNLTLTITINGVKDVRTTNDNGLIRMSINLPPGEYLVVVEYNGTEYEKVKTTAFIVVRSMIYGENIVKFFQNDTNYAATFFDKEGNVLTNTKVGFNINGVIYNRTTNSDGVASLKINLGPGKYILTATNYVTGEMKSNNITVLSILVENNDLIKYFQNGTQYTLKLLDKQGKVLKGEKVSFNINGQVYSRTTNNDGVASFAINLGPGNYIITANYGTCFVSNNVTVLSTIVDNKDVSKYFQNGTQYTVKLLDKQGNIYAGKKVSFNINGQVYSRTTNNDGVASFAINLGPGNYIITASYDGCFVSNNITVLSTIVSKDLNMKFGDGSKFSIKLVDKQGKAIQGKKVSFNINGILYQRTTTADGLAALDIKLPVGKYIITTSYDDFSIGKTVTVR